MKVLYVSRCASLFFSLWKGLSEAEMKRKILELEWLIMMRTCARKYVGELEMLMISIENLNHCRDRVLSRVNRWNNASVAEPCQSFKNKGFDVYLVDGRILSEPRDKDISESEYESSIMSVWPTVTRDKNGKPFNSSIRQLFDDVAGHAVFVDEAIRRNVAQNGDDDDQDNRDSSPTANDDSDDSDLGIDLATAAMNHTQSVANQVLTCVNPCDLLDFDVIDTNITQT
jgi:hypothetical protein